MFLAFEMLAEDFIEKIHNLEDDFTFESLG